MTSEARGFIVQATYRLEHDRPVVTLFTRLDDGRAAVIRDTRSRPRFYIAARDAAAAESHGAPRPRECPLRSMASAPLAVIACDAPAEVPPLRDRLEAAGISTFEADVRFATRYLIDRGVRGVFAVRGRARRDARLGLVFDDPEAFEPAPGEVTVPLRVVSLDIETDPRARTVLSFALVGEGVDEVWMLAPPGRDAVEGAHVVDSQHALLRAFCDRVREIDPDVLTGWNVVDFDLAVLDRVASRRRVPLRVGRDGDALRLVRDTSGRARSAARVSGRLVLDGIQLLRGAFVKMERYGLDHVARTVLGERKLVTGDDRADRIERMFRDEPEALARYNRHDARLVLRILDRLRLIDLAVERSKLTGMTLDRVQASIASFDFVYIGRLNRRGFAAPSVQPARPGGAAAGGHVLEPAPGLWENVLLFDFKSLYPSIIRTFEIDPLGLAQCDAAPDADPIVAPDGTRFARRRGILSEILDELFPRREQAQRRNDRVASQAIKILMNSFYGVLGTPACRFHDARLANAITAFGRHLLIWMRDRIATRGLRVLYGDTDSLFVLSGEADAERARDLGRRLAAELNAELAAYVQERWRVASRLELEFETLYRRLFLPPARGSAAGARKRYAGVADGGDGEPRVVFVGLEAVRRDWTDLARAVQRELYEKMFRGEPVGDTLREIVRQVRAGQRDDQLVYHKVLRKPAAAYTATTPPHVVAARAIGARPGAIVSYVITTNGPEPAAMRRSPLDREHYVERQIRPVAEPVLAVLGLDFAEVLGEARQQRLF